MKKLILLFAIAAVFGSCKKDEEKSSAIPASIYGNYDVTLERTSSPTGTYIHTWDITQNTPNSVLITSSHDLVGSPIVMDVSGSTLVIQSQSFAQPNFGNFTISGSGTFSNTQINLSLGRTYQGTTYQYSISAVK